MSSPSQTFLENNVAPAPNENPCGIKAKACPTIFHEVSRAERPSQQGRTTGGGMAGLPAGWQAKACPTIFHEVTSALVESRSIGAAVAGAQCNTSKAKPRIPEYNFPEVTTTY